MDFNKKSFSRVFGGRANLVYGVTEHYGFIFDTEREGFTLLPIGNSDFAANPHADFNETLDVAVLANPSAELFAYRLSDQKLLWTDDYIGLIKRIVILEESNSVVIDGDQLVVLSLETGLPINTKIVRYHMIRKLAIGCLATKCRTSERHYFRDSQTTNVLLDCTENVRFGVDSENFVALEFFDLSDQVYFYSLSSGKLVKKCVIPGCDLINALFFEPNQEDVLVLCRNAKAECMEVWRVSVSGNVKKLSSWSDGVWYGGWAFHRQASQAFSVAGHLVDVATGAVLRRGWSS